MNFAEDLLKIAKEILSDVEEMEEIEPEGSTPVKERKKEASRKLSWRELQDEFEDFAYDLRASGFPVNRAEFSVIETSRGIATIYVHVSGAKFSSNDLVSLKKRFPGYGLICRDANFRFDNQ